MLNTYIAFLRANNVGGYRKIRMQDLRDMLEKIIALFDNTSVSLVLETSGTSETLAPSGLVNNAQFPPRIVM